MRAGRKFKDLVCRFAQDPSGNFAMLMGILVITVLLAVGSAVNITQMYHVRSNLLASLDSAVTSTARDITTGVIHRDAARDMVERVMTANSRATFSTGNLFVLDDVEINDATRTLEATAHAYVDLAFPFFGSDPLVSASSAAIYSDKRVEIAMMLDITGSMAATRASNKIGDLKTAAINAVNIALAQNFDPDNPRVRVAIVPYAEAVNAGALADQTVFVEQAGGRNLPPPYDAPIQVSAGRSDNCASERKLPSGAADVTDDGPATTRIDLDGKSYPAKVNRDDRIEVCPQAALVPLTSNSAALHAAISNFRANGTTAGGIGIQWTYYMLSPNWRGAITDAGLGNGPANWNGDKIAKVAILMTDGVFNTAFSNKTRIVTGDPSSQASAARANAEGLCARMRADGIEIYTIGFQLPDAEARTVLRNCSTPDTGGMRHYFETSTGAELDAAFQEIVANTERLALTK
jgi:Flp pilus assembly protein TadG